MKNLIIIALMTVLLSNLKAQEINYLSPKNDLQNQIINFKLTDFTIEDFTTTNQTFSIIKTKSSLRTTKKGFPEIPYFTLAVQIPNLDDMELSIELGEYEEMKLQNHILPSRGVLYRNQDIKSIPYKYSTAGIEVDSYPIERATITTPYIVKDVRGLTISFYPFEYDAAEKTLRVYKSIKVILESNAASSTNPLVNTGQTNSVLNSVYKSLFKNYSPLADNSRNIPYSEFGDLLVISTERDNDAIQPYIKWKREKSFNVEHITVATGTNVKDLVQQKYDANNNLFYVCLVGDWDDVKSDVGHAPTDLEAPCDNRMGCVVGTDAIPDISIGRISADSPAQVTAQVNKILYYEKEIDENADWLSKVLQLASNEGPGDDNEMDAEHMSILWNNKLSPFTYTGIDSLYDKAGAFITASQATSVLNTGVGIINYIGHGSEDAWSTSDFGSQHIPSLNSENKTPFIISVACVNGAFQWTGGECFAENFVRKENGGAIIFLGSTINQPWNEPMRGQDYMNDLLIGGYDYTQHSGQNGISTDGQRTTFGSISFNSFALMLTESPNPADQETVDTWTLFGDPTLQVRTRQSDTLTISNDTLKFSLPFNTTINTDGSKENLVVALSQENKVYKSFTDANGTVSIAHDFLPGKATLTVTGFNKKTITKEVDVLSLNAAAPLVTDVTLKASEGIVNNIQYDQSITCDLKVKNYGPVDANAFTIKLKSSSTDLTITDSLVSVSGITANDSITLENKFQFKLAEPVADESNYTLIFSITYGENDFNKSFQVEVAAPNIEVNSFTIVDTGLTSNGILDPGETALLKINLKNTGALISHKITSLLSTASQYIAITSVTDTLTNISVDSNKTLVYKLVASADTPLETAAKLKLQADYSLLQIKDSIEITIGKLPTINIKNGIDSVSTVWFYDDGGENQNYSLNKTLTHTFYPKTTGKAVKIEFSYFDVEKDYDYISIFDGVDANTTLLIKATGKTNIPPFTASNDDGALTVRFESDQYVVSKGWKAKITNTEIVTNVKNGRSEIPTEYALMNNYPNPFNPSTIIGFALPQKDIVTLEIFNILGEKVITLLNNVEFNAGVHKITWKGINQSSGRVATGLYLYRIKTESFSTTKKMLLIK